MGKAITNTTSSGKGWSNPHMAAASRAIAKRIPLFDLVLKFRDAMGFNCRKLVQVALKKSLDGVLLPLCASEVRWRPPSVGILKLNVDGAINVINGTRGAGGIVRDDRGWLVGAVMMKAPNIVSILAMGLYALELGISFAVDAG
ncbi:mitochondrial ribosome-associated GTPase 1 [Pyrus ussuriensis x Pyrus communis]|uniref:Mitochondrial ribosome-associated GTPase 1 n=1 Tax=Pyrus ussuriensis x Pyrus communis TaxID=2448454 RepID=A0A5N5F906_9ROSA|nr:mitochondrial ribosome-associated GTPase 1 [Pyrus ussuriensis x Pyrus communis]